MSNIFSFREKYKIYKDDILQYVVNMENMFSISVFIIFFVYFIYMKLRNYFNVEKTGFSSVLCLCMVVISLLDFLIVEKYVKYHVDKALIVTLIRSILMLGILCFMDLYSNISYTLIASSIMFMSITNNYDSRIRSCKFGSLYII